MKVLFIEDNSLNRRVLHDMLDLAGVEMDEAENAETGMLMLGEGKYAMLFVDLRMPGLDGLTAIRRIRERRDAVGRVQTIVITADTASDLRERCLAAGADDVLFKPVEMDVLFNAIGRMLAKSEVDVLID